MTASVDGLRLRKVFGRKDWEPPIVYGPDGWAMRTFDHSRHVIVSVSDWDGVEWVHASIATTDKVTTPTYEDLKMLHPAVFTGPAYQVFVREGHINIHETALHLFGRLDGKHALPDFGQFGTI